MQYMCEIFYHQGATCTEENISSFLKRDDIVLLKHDKGRQVV